MKEDYLSFESYLEYLQSQGRYWFLRQDAMTSLSLTANAFKKAVYRLSSKNKVSRVRADFFIIIPPEYRASGSLPASWFIDPLMKYLQQEYYVALLTAASLHGVAHQQPMIFQVVTNKQTRSIIIGQVKIEFIFKKKILPFFYQFVKTVTGTMKVSIPEMVAFDSVRYMDAAGQINNIATIMSELVKQLNTEKLVELLRNDSVEIVVAQRLGYLLDFLKLPIELELFEKALKSKKPVKRLLIPGINQPVIEHNYRWQILVNELVEPDEL